MWQMDNVLIDDRRIHVDFSQSVGRLWNRFRKIGTKDSAAQGGEGGEERGLRFLGSWVLCVFGYLWGLGF